MATRRLGFILPSANGLLERELPDLLPAGVSGHFARARFRTTSASELAGLKEQVPAAAASLADAGADVVGLACTTGSLVGGPGYDAELISSIRAATGGPATTTATAVIEALKAFGVSRVTLVTPYEDWLNRIEVEFLEAHDVRVVAEYGFALPESRDIEDVPPDAIEEAVVATDVAESDAVFVSCTNFQGLATVDSLERKLGKPVVTSNQATVWSMLRLVGVDQPIAGYGRLFAL